MSKEILTGVQLTLLLQVSPSMDNSMNIVAVGISTEARPALSEIF